MRLFKIGPSAVVDLDRVEQFWTLMNRDLGCRTIMLKFITGRTYEVHEGEPEFSALLEFINNNAVN